MMSRQPLSDLVGIPVEVNDGLPRGTVLLVDRETWEHFKTMHRDSGRDKLQAERNALHECVYATQAALDADTGRTVEKSAIQPLLDALDEAGIDYYQPPKDAP